MTLSHELRSSDKWEKHFTKTFPQFNLTEIQPFMGLIPPERIREKPLRVFDVGANAGLWTASMLEYYGRHIGEMHCFEPMPGNIQFFKNSMDEGLYADHLAKIRLNEFGLSDKPGNVKIHYENELTGLASIDNELTYMPARVVEMLKSRTIEVKTLDDYCAAEKIDRIDILKVDIEGHELPVLKGAERLFKKKQIGVVSFECGVHQMARREFYKDFYEFFADHGYSNWRYRETGWAPVKIGAYHSRLEDFERVHMYLGASIL